MSFAWSFYLPLCSDSESVIVSGQARFLCPGLGKMQSRWKRHDSRPFPDKLAGPQRRRETVELVCWSDNSAEPCCSGAMTRRNPILPHGARDNPDCVWRRTGFPSAQGDASRFDARISAVMGVVVGRCKQGPLRALGPPAFDRWVSLQRVGLGSPNPMHRYPLPSNPHSFFHESLTRIFDFRRQKQSTRTTTV